MRNNPVRSSATLLAALLLAACAVQPPAATEPPAETAAEAAIEPVTEAAPQPAAPDSPAVTGTAADGAEETGATPSNTTKTVAPAYNKSDVIWIQQRLQQLGYFDGTANGTVDSKTRNAVREYQRDQALDVDGRPTAQLREFMWRNGG